MRKFSLFVVMAYVSVQLISNISSTKIAIVCGYAVDMGVFLYPFAFTLRDVVHKEIGKENTKTCIYIAALMNLLMACYFYFVALFPADASVPTAVAFDDSLAPVWRIVLSSLFAQIVGELIDTEVYHAFYKRFKEKHKWGRVVVSNTISIPIDNALFCIGAFGWIYPWPVVLQIIVFNFVVKYVISLASIPLIYVGAKK